jgi:hypothetical protein
MERALQSRQSRLLCLGLLSFLFVCLTGLFIFLLARDKANIPEDLSRTLNNDFKPLSIAPEDVFLPDEPDFLPEVLLNREPRNPWTAEEVRPFWTDPLQDDPEWWQERIKVTIDAFLEGVP